MRRATRQRPSVSTEQDWRLLLALFCVGTLIEITAWGHMQAFTPLFLSRELAVDAADVPFWTGVLAALPLAIAVPLAPFWGALADRYSRKLIIVRSLFAESLAYAVASLSGSLLAFVVVRLIMGFAFGNNALVVAVISLVTLERRLGTAVGVFTAMFPIGLSVGPLMGSGLIALGGPRLMLAVDAALCLFAATMLLLFVREPARDPAALSVGIRERLGTIFALVARMPSIRWNFVLWFLISGGVAAMDPYLPVLITDLYQGSSLALTIGVVLAIFGAASAICTPFTPRLVDRFGASRVLLFACLVLALVAFVSPFAPTVAIVAAILLLRAAPQAATATTLFTHLARHAPREHRAGVMALSPLPRNLALLIAPLAGSALSALGLGAVFALGGLFFLTAAVVSRVLERAERTDALPLARGSEA